MWEINVIIPSSVRPADLLKMLCNQMGLRGWWYGKIESNEFLGDLPLQYLLLNHDGLSRCINEGCSSGGAQKNNQTGTRW